MSAIEATGRHLKGREGARGAKEKSNPRVLLVTTVGAWGLVLQETFGSWGGAPSPIISRSELMLSEGRPRSSILRLRESTKKRDC